MFETIFTSEPRDRRNPLHPTISDAIEYGLANTEPGDEIEVWQVADDTVRTRMQLVQRLRNSYQKA
jgi:hypothetical protein